MTTVGELLEWSRANYPDKLGLIFKEKNHYWTFTEFDEKANQFANALIQLGVGKGDVVSTFLYNSSEFALTQFATAKIGAIFNPINYRLTAAELQYILNNAESKVLVFDELSEVTVSKAIELGVNVKHFLYTNENTPEFSENLETIIHSQSKEKPNIKVTENDPYILMYTSGTTGRPKGVIHKHRDMVHHNFLMMQCQGFTKNDIGLTVAPLFHTAELHTSFLPRVQVGATNIILHHFDAKQVLQTIEEEKVTHLFAPPTMVNMLLNDQDFDNYNTDSLRLVGYGGASMAPVLIRRFLSKTNAELVQMLGTTEMGPVFSVLFSDEQLAKAGSAGKQILTHEIRVVRRKEDGRPTHPDDICDVDEVGEIIVKGPCMMQEYYKREEATEKALAYGWYHTGDLGHIDADGYLWVRDRMDFMINTGAENVYPREVEDNLMEHPSVAEVGVVGKPDPKWGEIVVAFVVLKNDESVTAEELDTFLINNEKLARYKRPREYHFVDQLPKTASGKIQKFKLENLLKVQN